MKDKLIETLKELAKNPKGKSKTVAVKDLSSTDLKNLFGIFEHLVGNKKYTVSISFPATDRVARVTINVNAAFESDPEAVRALLIEAARAQDAVLSIPAPLALFSEFGDWSMKFQLIAYVEDALMAERVKSELNFDVMARMRAASLRIPYPFPVGNVEAERGPNASKLV